MHKGNKRLLVKIGILALCCLVLALTAARAQDTVTVKTFTFKHVVDTDLQLDVFTPPHANGSLPVILLFHGGSWVSGDKSQLHWQCRYFAEHGIVAITANYRLLGKDTGRKDLCITDARSAARWVKQHAAALGIDTLRIILGGASAGGHLATMAVLNQELNDIGDGNSSPVSARALVLLNPAFNTSEPPAVQPYTFPTEAFPPAIFFFGSKDKWKPAADSLIHRLLDAKKTHELWLADGETHGFFNRQPWNLATCERALQFLQRQGLTGTKPAVMPAGSLLRLAQRFP